MTNHETTIDEFLGGKITLAQPAKGYRVTSDSVYLAATVSLKSGERVLDVGAGSGAILSCVAARLKDNENTMHGIEIQQELLSLAHQNAKDNGFEDRINYFSGDILNDIEECLPNSYHHVLSNPPYYEKGKVTASPHKTKAVAHGNEMVDLKVWLQRCLRMVRPRGYLTLVHRADLLDDILSALTPKAGAITIFPFYSKEGKDANRVIIRAQKDAKGLLTLKSGLIVHKSDGTYTEAAENILRHGQYLDLSN